MTTPLRPPTPLLSQRQDLERVALRIFKEQTASDECAVVAASSLGELASAIVDAVRHALASKLQTYNEDRLVQPRLPSEIWSNVWVDLNAHDGLTVTQVSHSWRHIASRCPQLWNNFSMATSRHKAGCDCDICDRPYDDEVHETQELCKWCLRRPRHLNNNVLLAQHLIGRTVGDIMMFALDIWTVIRKPMMLRSITVTSILINDLFHEAPDLCFTNLEIQFGHTDLCESLTQWLDPNSAVVHRIGAFTELDNLTIKATYQKNWMFDFSEAEIFGSIMTRLGLHGRKGVVKLTTEGLLINTGVANWPVWEELAAVPTIL